MQNEMFSVRNKTKSTLPRVPFDKIKEASSVLNKKLQHHDDSAKPLFKYFSDVIDAREINPEEYDKYREIYLTAPQSNQRRIYNPCE